MPTPDPEQTNRIRAEDVRCYLEDRTAEDNPFLMDLAFSDAEIHQAMRFTALKYNSIAPYIDSVQPDNIPFRNEFLNGIAYNLLRSRLQRIRRNRVAYQAGNMQVDADKQRIEYMERWQEMFFNEFMQEAKQKKIQLNVKEAFGHY